MALTVVEYVREDGSNPYRTWFRALPAQAAAKVATATLRLEMGNTSNVKWLGALGEYRIDWGPGYRIYDWKSSNNHIFQAVIIQRNVMFLILTLIILVASFNIISSLIMPSAELLKVTIFTGRS